MTLAATPVITHAAYNRYTWHYSFDEPAVAAATGGSIARLPDGKRWAAIVADAGFDKSAFAAFAPMITANATGG